MSILYRVHMTLMRVRVFVCLMSISILLAVEIHNKIALYYTTIKAYISPSFSRV